MGGGGDDLTTLLHRTAKHERVPFYDLRAWAKEVVQSCAEPRVSTAKAAAAAGLSLPPPPQPEYELLCVCLASERTHLAGTVAATAEALGVSLTMEAEHVVQALAADRPGLAAELEASELFRRAVAEKVQWQEIPGWVAIAVETWAERVAREFREPEPEPEPEPAPKAARRMSLAERSKVAATQLRSVGATLVAPAPNALALSLSEPPADASPLSGKKPPPARRASQTQPKPARLGMFTSPAAVPLATAAAPPAPPAARPHSSSSSASPAASSTPTPLPVSVASSTNSADKDKATPQPKDGKTKRPSASSSSRRSSFSNSFSSMTAAAFKSPSALPLSPATSPT
jgi:hypothetical protein